MYTVTVENRGEATYHATSRGYGFVLGPPGAGANPGDTLLAALCGCIGHYVRQFLRERALAPDGFVIQAEADSTPDESRLAGIRVRIGVEGPPLDETGQAELLAATERCKIHRTLQAACAVTVTLGPIERRSGATPRAGAGGCGA